MAESVGLAGTERVDDGHSALGIARSQLERYHTAAFSGFRCMPISDSGACRSVIPVHAGHDAHTCLQRPRQPGLIPQENLVPPLSHQVKSTLHFVKQTLQRDQGEQGGSDSIAVRARLSARPYHSDSLHSGSTSPTTLREFLPITRRSKR